MNPFEYTSLDAIVRVIQSSLTPAFLLTAVASLLNVFATRLGRVSDQVKAMAQNGVCDAVTLRRRSRLLDLAVILGAFAGACVTATVLVLFLGLVLTRAATVAPLFVLFGIAVFCTIGALTAFLFEVLLASRHVRAEVDRKTEKVESFR